MTAAGDGWRRSLAERMDAALRRADDLRAEVDALRLALRAVAGACDGAEAVTLARRALDASTRRLP